MRVGQAVTGLCALGKQGLDHKAADQRAGGDACRSFGYDRRPMTDTELLRRKLEELRLEHRDLDDVIARLSEQVPVSAVQIQRLKKRKLLLKDQIALLESRLLPDIIA